MENLLDIGVEEYRIAGAGVLRFHPGDPNLFARFLAAEKDIQALEKELAEEHQAGKPVLQTMEAADAKIKEMLNRVFGGDNDFHQALGGVNLLAVGKDGRTLLSVLFEALEKILKEGADRFAKAQTEKLKNGENESPSQLR